MNQYDDKYKPRKCRYCGKLFIPMNSKNKEGIRGGRQPLYCSDECRTKWRREYALRIKWSRIDEVRKNDVEYHRRIIKDRQKNGVFFLYDRIDNMIQKVLDLELYPFQIDRVRFKVTYQGVVPVKYDKILVAYYLDKTDKLNLSTEYLLTHESYDEDDFDV